MTIFMCKNHVSFLPLLTALQEKLSMNPFHIYIQKKLLSVFIQYLQFPYVCRFHGRFEIEFPQVILSYTCNIQLIIDFPNEMTCFSVTSRCIVCNSSDGKTQFNGC